MRNDFVSNARSVSDLKAHVNEFYRKDVLWSSSYFIASCGGVTVSTLRKYIENQDGSRRLSCGS
ncbi:transposase [Microcoleus sp. bin48.metabat.b7b8b9.023]|uniref:transposase n=1 Tax=unclassified Microcoleus TaxID=2642155 RepID=UPI0034512C19